MDIKESSNSADEEKEIPQSLLANLIKWMRNRGISDEDIVDCMLYICGKDIDELEKMKI